MDGWKRLMNKVNIAVEKQLLEKRLLGEGRPEAESRYRKCLGNIEGEHQGQDQPKRRMPKTARTVLWEDGG